jgi:LysR family transcriptional activator of nhaA
MDWMNYHHLFYFWVAAREGNITRASALLNVSQPAVSRQIGTLETALGEKLFRKQGRTVALTDVGRVVFDYADEIFALGRELTEAVKRRSVHRPARLMVGVADVVPKLVAYRLIRPAFTSASRLQVVVREDDPQRLFAALALHELDVVITDAPITAAVSVKAFNHILGESGVVFLGAQKFAALRRNFPSSLDGAPMLMPVGGTELRRALEHWLETNSIRPEIVGEFEDSALAKAFAHAGIGVVVAPAVIEKEVRRQYGLCVLGRTDEIRERFYAVSAERKLTHPGVLAITEAAREKLFA